jgi:hypothetical protein
MSRKRVFPTKDGAHRERPSRAREGFETKTCQVNEGLEKISALELMAKAEQQTQMSHG